MGKFITVSFLALGAAFYHFSGGSDFVPEQPIVVAETEITPNADVTDPRNVDVSRNNAASLISLNPAVTTVSLNTTPEPIIVDGVVTEPVAADPITEEEIVAIVAEPLDIRAVAGSRVNMRQGPGTDFSVLNTLDGGTQAEVLEVNADGWARIQVVGTGQTGWMAERLLSDG